MATTKKRVNISLPKWAEEALKKLAKRDEMPTASKAAELIKTAIEIEEDQVWDQLANERLKNSKGFISHEDAWK
ncbi:MAG: hypothetical protein ISR98_00930 [Parcubacteria group bacterium]|nr:hypothetical protein [Parcubacteria group bacterium]